MVYRLPDPTDLNNGPAMDDLYMPLKFKHHITKSMIDPIKAEGRPRDFSAIVFGPPGTGKTSIIRAIAREIGWELVEIGPHDLARHPESVEHAITDTFQKIHQRVDKRSKKDTNGMARTVVMLDEIDALVTARGSKSDRAANFITTMMLPLLQELRDFAGKRGMILFVLTNHIERFDPAVKRKGRFDLILPLGPPDHKARFMWFKSCMRSLNAHYKQKYNLTFLTDYEHVPERREPGSGELEPMRIKYTNFDVLARASHGLSFADISAICDRVLDRRIATYPILRTGARRENRVIVYTSNFIDWINKYRESDPVTQDEIEKFYRDADVYARGVYPYAHRHTLQEKVENEFSSLTIEHNLNTPGIWKAGKESEVVFSLTNLSEFGVFSGIVNLKISLDGQDEVRDMPEVSLLPGVTSREYRIKFVPSKKGMMKVAFSTWGEFHLRGGESILDQNSAELSGSVTHKKDVRVE